MNLWSQAEGTCNRSPFLSHMTTGGGTASDLHSSVTCLFLNTVKSWDSSIPAILGGTKRGNTISSAFDKLDVNIYQCPTTVSFPIR